MKKMLEGRNKLSCQIQNQHTNVSCISVHNEPSKEIKKNSIHKSVKQNKIPRNKHSQGQRNLKIGWEIKKAK